MNAIYTDSKNQEVLTAVKSVLKEDLQAVSDVFEDIVFWVLWITDPDEFQSPSAAAQDFSKPENVALFNAISRFVRADFDDSLGLSVEDVIRTLFEHSIFWESWYWGRKVQEDADEYNTLRDIHGATYGEDYGDTFSGVFDGHDAPFMPGEE